MRGEAAKQAALMIRKVYLARTMIERHPKRSRSDYVGHQFCDCCTENPVVAGVCAMPPGHRETGI